MTNSPEVSDIITRKELCRKLQVCKYSSPIAKRTTNIVKLKLKQAISPLTAFVIQHFLVLKNNSCQLHLLGERYVYKFVCDPEALFNMAYGSTTTCTEGSTSPPNSCRNNASVATTTNGNSTLNDRQFSQYYTNYQ